ncbi:monofunctional biosynthetic peptidoglycan transglycosylase [Rhodobium orientis]|uniref:Biosynthetic peptidoglycan transglycosylase n=2 Tax=Rhodobium orientis TaxID=34017 RepID=A0A327JQJ1_9HYPH|nr:monofunctional biosynthetic peptidoglycan transglycosylase [Rhodobium orientis]MBK5951852.1 monofunctional biosynthetic peptidoglycan transglycosylase [Rhodobium orientis]RAI28547.1 monofunctional biosynthetic peptidoglycan transglycosylase [Rhodobium orientis]
MRLKPTRRLLKRLVFVVAALILLPFLLIPLYRFINPPASTLMLRDWVTGASVTREWVSLAAISPNLVRAVVMSEDARFCEHDGIDWEEVQNALEDLEDGKPRGASTLNMQLSKNLFLWSSRSYLRKVVEAPLALYMDVVLPKRRIVELYLNVVEWGPGVFGAEAAAQRYFKRPAAKLTRHQASLMAAALPNPIARNPASPGQGHARIARRIAGRAAKSGAYLECVLGKK